MMNRTFHARVTAWQYLLLGLMGVLTLCLLWYKLALPSLLLMLGMIVFIEKLIHTTYTLTFDGRLRLCFGRFLRGKEIPLQDITTVYRVNFKLVGRFTLSHYLLVEYAGKSAKVLPVNESEFIRLLQEQRSRRFRPELN